MTIWNLFSIFKEIITILWNCAYGFLRGIWPTLDAQFDATHKIIIAVIVGILGAIGVPTAIRNIVKHF